MTFDDLTHISPPPPPQAGSYPSYPPPATSHSKWKLTALLLAAALIVETTLIGLGLVGIGPLEPSGQRLAVIVTATLPPMPTNTTPPPISTAIPVPPPTLSVQSPSNNAVLTQGVPITCSGHYTGLLPNPFYVWVVLEDSSGNYYLQTPAVQFYPDGSWIASHVVPGQGITKLVVVQVDTAGNSEFQDMVKNQQFGAFSPLPAGNTPLATVSIQVQ